MSRSVRGVFFWSSREASIMNTMRLAAAMMVLFGAIGQSGGRRSTLNAEQTKNALRGTWEASSCSIYNPTCERREELDVSRWTWEFKVLGGQLTFSWKDAPRPIAPSEIDGTIEIADIDDDSNPGELAVDLIFRTTGQDKVYRGRGVATRGSNGRLKELWLVLPAEWEVYRQGDELTENSDPDSQSSRPAQMEQGRNSRARSFFLNRKM